MNLTEILSAENPPPKPRYTVRDAAYALQPQSPLDWIIKGLVTAGSVNIFYGEGGSKKTYSMLSLGVCVAVGKPWLGFETQACNVLVIDEESGEKRLTLRLAAALRGELATENTPVKYVSLAQFKIEEKNDKEEIKKLIQETQSQLVIIDALADIMDGDENSKQDTQPILAALRKIAEESGTAIILIHHSNKTGGYRGSTAIKGAVDLMVQVISEDGSKWVNFKTEKNRDGEALAWSAAATWTEDQFYLEYVEKKPEQKGISKSQEYVLRYLKEHGPSPLPDIAGAADSCSPSAARQAVYTLTSHRRIYRTNPQEKGKGAVAIYDIYKEGKE